MNFDSEKYIGEYIDRARKAQEEYEKFSQEQVDRIVQAVGKAVFDNAEELAEFAVEETGMGNYEDKVTKNKSKARIIWNDLRDKNSIGIIERNEKTGITKIAKPIGVVAAITPTTNPIVTPMSNIMFALKGGNAIIITPHHRAKGCSTKTVEYINGAIKKLGAPDNLVQILDIHSRENTRNLISGCDVAVATGGMGMVKAAYSSGKPALGVGAGNVQCIIDDGSDLEKVIPMVVAGRTFDNGIICSGEQSIIVSEDRFDETVDELKKNNTLVVTDDEAVLKMRNAIFEDGTMNKHLVGQSVFSIGEFANMDIPDGTKMIAVLAEGAGNADVLSKEKMCPVIALFKANDFKDAVEIARLNLEEEGKGHSVSIHSNNRDNIEYAGANLSVSRFIINQSCASTAGGSFYNGLNPTNTLGCGSWGNNSISENLTYYHLINISRIADYMPNNYVPTDEELWESI
jgi:succinate-semialdehyde dehydrogenase